MCFTHPEFNRYSSKLNLYIFYKLILIYYFFFQDNEKAFRCNDDIDYKNVTNRCLLGSYKKQSRLTFAKCQAIWNNQEREPF